MKPDSAQSQSDQAKEQEKQVGGATASLAYLNAVREVLNHLETTQLEAVEAAAGLVVDALRNRGAVFCWEIGHGVQHDFIDRAGGLAAIKPFSFQFSVPDALPEVLKNRPRPGTVDQEIEAIRLAVRTGNLRAGDVLFLGSVSGRNARPVELAMFCREQGVKVVGFTSMTYTKNVESVHPSGKKLCDVVNVVLDNGAPYGDAAVEIAGLDRSALPVSGVGMAVAGWMIWGRVIEKMAAAGDPPTVFMSLNRAGGQEIYEKSITAYRERGY